MAPAPETQLIGASDFQDILSDALASFSPLATLVGSDSARSLTQHVTNTKQTFVASLAPIGALGMMASVCKGANLPGLKDMLGAGDANILDSCKDLGCGALHGIVPGMSPRDGLTTERKEGPQNRGASACGILRASCVLGETKNGPGVDMTKMMAALQSFSGSTVSGRFQWAAKDREEQWKLVCDLERVIVGSFNGTHQWDQRIFDLIHAEEALKAGKVTYELHWPSPAMPMETNPWIVFAFGGTSALTFLLVVVISTVREWQTVPAAFLLVGGQAVLATGHVAAQWTLKRQRETVYIDLPQSGFSDTWMLVDRVWFTFTLARRPLARGSNADRLRVGQYLGMKNMYIPTWQAILTLAAIGIGFIAFYVGAKSSNVWTILAYIGLFFVVNIAKGHVVTLANKAEVTRLNNPGLRYVLQNENKPPGPGRPWWRRFYYKNNATPASADHGTDTESPPDTRDAVEMSNLPQAGGKSFRGSSKRSLSQDHLAPDLFSLRSRSSESEDGSFSPRNIPLPPSTSSNSSYQQLSDEEAYSAAQIPLPPSEASMKSGIGFNGLKIQHRVFAKMAVRHSLAMGMFYFGRPEAWGTAAHVIYDTCQRHVAWQWPPNLREPFVYLPLGYHISSDEFVDAALVLAIDETRHEDVFWSAGMEFMSVLLDNFLSDTHLVSELPRSADLEPLGLYVYHVIKLLLSASGVDAQGMQFDSPGRASMMRAIELVKNKYPYDDTDVTLPTFRAYAQAASQL